MGCKGIPIYEVLEQDAIDYFVAPRDSNPSKSEFLASDKEVDPLLIPNYGPPWNPYVAPVVSREIDFLLSQFADFAPGAVLNIPPLIPPGFAPPAGGGYQYHAQIAITQVQQEIMNPQQWAVLCPNILQVPIGAPLCDLNIAYANCVVVVRLKRF